MNRTITISMLSAGMACTCWASVWWTGAAGNGDWNTPENWNNKAVPPLSETAKFERQAVGNYLFRLTPPSDFTGVIWLGSEADRRAFSMTVELTVLDGASWMVQGVGTVIATPGIAERLSPSDFKGTIEVPAGRTFVAPASLNAAVTFTGAGKLQLSSPEQFAQARGFVGEITSLSGVNVTPESLVAFENARLTLGDGDTVSLPASTLGTTAVTPLSGFAQADAWSFNGTAYADGPNAGGPSGDSYKFNKNPPSVTEGGDLLLTDDPAQVHTVFYKERKMRLSDSWGVSFTWTPEMPSPSRVTENGWNQVMSGHFGFYLQKGSPESVDLSNKQIMASGAEGFVIYIYHGGQNHIEWITDIGYNFNDCMRESVLDGISFEQPVDFSITCNQGVMSVTLEQNGKSASFRKDFSTYISSSGDGVYIGFGGASDLWPDNTTAIPWMQQTVSDFSGWCSARNSGGWREVSDASAFYPFTEATWLMHSFYSDGSKKSGAEAEINKDGSFQIIPAANKTAGLVTCRRTIDVDKPALLSFDYRFEACPGGNPGSAEGLEFGFQQLHLNDDALNTLNWQKEGGGWNGRLNPWSKAWGFYYYFWGNGFVELRHQFMESNAWKATVQKNDAILIPRSYATAHFDVTYDALGSLRVYGSVTPDDPSVPGSQAEFVQTLTSDEFAQFKTDMGNHCRISFVGFSSAADVDRYQQTAIKNVTLKELVDNASPTLDSTLSVAPSANATVTAGLAKPDAASQAVTFADVSLAAGSTLHVAPEGASTRVSVSRVAAEANATLASDSGATLTLDTFAPTDIGNTLTLTGSVAFADEFTIVIPDANLRNSGLFTLIDLSGATVVKSPTTVRVVSEGGIELVWPEYRPIVRGNAVLLSVRQGFAIIIR